MCFEYIHHVLYNINHQSQYFFCGLCCKGKSASQLDLLLAYIGDAQMRVGLGGHTAAPGRSGQKSSLEQRQMREKEESVLEKLGFSRDTSYIVPEDQE